MRLMGLWIVLMAALWAQDIDTLLQQVKAQNSSWSQELQAREARFAKEKEGREAALRDAKAELEALKRETKRLQEGFENNEARILEREKSLKERTGNLGELFGVVRQSAGDMAALVRNSAVSAQIPQRYKTLHVMAQSKRLPSESELQKLWLMMLEEIVESGKTTSFDAQVVHPDGSASNAKVLRAGLFTLVSEGKFLRYDVDKEQLIELPRQPESRYLALASQMQESPLGISDAVIDPTRGAILELLMDMPTAAERMAQGGVIGYIILMLGALGLLIALVRGGVLLVQSRRIAAQLKAIDTPNTDNPLGRLLGVYGANASEEVEIVESRLDEAILKELPSITRGEALIKLLAAVAPLLGLLGTVVGMIETFQAITLFGTGDPKLMAGGISQALVTTMQGLIVAVPLLFAHALVRSRSRAIIEILSQQSAGLIARRMERR